MRPRLDVLVIDHHDRDVRTTLTGIRQGSETATVLRLKNPDEALQYLFRSGADAKGERAHPRLIILEVDLPTMSGLLVLDRLQTSSETRSIPVVVYSANDEPLIARDAVARGAKAFLQKPSDKGQYIERVAAVVERYLEEASSKRDMRDRPAISPPAI